MLGFFVRVTICVVLSTALGLIIMNYAYRMVDVAADTASGVMEAD